MVSRVQLPPEIQLAQRLAGNEKVTRDRAVKKLRKYIVARTQRAAGGFTHEELLKVWKGLFYCMWMQDKPLLQEELGRTISQLLHAFQTTEAQHLFLQTFWQTMNREWTGIDRLRLDKYYMLMRMILNESLKALQMRGWEESQCEQLLKLLMTEILHPESQAPHGVKSHFTEIFLEELGKVGAKELTADQNLKFIDPFCRIAARTQDPRDLHNIARGIFETIVEQAPFAIEDLMNELGEQEEGEEEEMSEEGDLSEDGDLEETEQEGEPEMPATKPAEMRRKASIHRPEPEAGEELAEDDRDGAGAMLQFDYEAVANRLFKMASQQNTPSQNRKRLYKVVRKLQDLAAGIFPEDDVPEKVYAYRHEGRLARKMKKRLLKSQLQDKKGRTRGKGGTEELSPVLSSRAERRKRKVRRPGPDVHPEGAAPREQSRGRGRRGARGSRHRKSGVRAKVAVGAEFQEPKKKKKRIQDRQEVA
ncbi:ribosomal RNA processing protein 1 homolog A [Elephas maximus indicus]|uniref:ribosomal RNA processing protein 1 homolog A n=1 Tax=Elephas maximus indicus TaxID=99487 RepID=UPI002115FF00|nr:ribosomal RNA processing protein 1 homolog A [Elephas maximus indicus]